MAALSGVLMSALTVAPAAAAGPKAPGGEAPLTAEQRAASDRKVAAASAYLAGVAASGVDLVSLQCVTPTERDARTGNAGLRRCRRRTSRSRRATRSSATTAGPPSGRSSRTTPGRSAPGGNKFTQAKIAGWMGTDANGGTSSQSLANGLETPLAERRAGPPSGSGW